MTAPSVTNTLANGNTVDGPQLNTNFSDLITYVSNRNDGSAVWDRVLVTNSSSVPLIVNQTGISANIANFQNNGTNYVQITNAGDIISVAFTDYSATSTIVGFASYTTKLVTYKKVGNLVLVWFDLLGISNDTVVTFTLPYAINSTSDLNNLGRSVDNGVAQTSPCRVNAPASSSTITVVKDMAGAAWTSSGTKRAAGEFFYQTG